MEKILYDGLLKYDSCKYPEGMYENLLTPKRITQQWIRKALLWKYGKVEGKNIPKNQRRTIDWFISNRRNISICKKINRPELCPYLLKPRTNYYTSPIFLAHLLYPNYWAIIDRHNIRFANYFLNAQGPRLRINWHSSTTMMFFLQCCANKHKGTVRQMDKIFMVLGKNLKRSNGRQLKQKIKF